MLNTPTTTLVSARRMRFDSRCARSIRLHRQKLARVGLSARCVMFSTRSTRLNMRTLRLGRPGMRLRGRSGAIVSNLGSI
jgi:hypothetical protein